jgi:hypothetical protein
MFDEPVKSQKSRHSCASSPACGGMEDKINLRLSASYNNFLACGSAALRPLWFKKVA